MAWNRAVPQLLCAPLPDSEQVCKYPSGIWKMPPRSPHAAESSPGSSFKTISALSDARGGCHCLYPGCPFICGPTLTSVLSVFIFTTNSAPRLGYNTASYFIGTMLSAFQCLFVGILRSGLVSNLQLRWSMGKGEVQSRCSPNSSFELDKWVLKPAGNTCR